MVRLRDRVGIRDRLWKTAQFKARLRKRVEGSIGFRDMGLSLECDTGFGLG